MGKSLVKETIVDKFNKKQGDLDKEQRQAVYICNGGGKGCASKKGPYMTDDVKKFRCHVNKVHKSKPAKVKGSKMSLKFNKSIQTRDVEEKKFIYVCKGDKSKACNFKSNSQGSFDSHISRIHNASDEMRTANLARMRQFASRKSASKSLTSAIKLEEQEKTPLLEIEDVTSEDDENSPSFQEFDKYYNDLAGEEEMHLPYHATFFVAYFVPGTTDVGLMNTYEMEKYTERFTFFLYFATSRKETCIHLKQTKNKTAQSRLVELMNKGAVCYRQNFVFSGQTTTENRENAFKWQQFWKNVKQMKKRVKPDGNTCTWEILNHALLRKVGYTTKITRSNFHKARRFATQNRPFLPLAQHLLPVDQFPQFKKYRLI